MRRSVEIETDDGTCPAMLSIPDGKGPWPAVIMLADAGGMRETTRAMADRLSTSGYLVLLPDFYYRAGPYGPFDMRTAFTNHETLQKIGALMQGYTAAMFARDAVLWADFLESLPEKKAGGIGVTGYCLGGRLSLTMAADLGTRVSAAASFHGGNLAVPDDPDSPHHKAAAIKSVVYVAGATADHYFTEEQRQLLDKSLTESGVEHTIETYPGRHGFAMADMDTYDEPSAERHWKALERLFGSTLSV